MLFLLHAHVCCRWIWKYSHHSSAHCIGLEAIDNTWRQHLSSADVLCFDVIWLWRQEKIASKPRDYDGVGMRSIDVGFVCVSRYSMKTKVMKREDIFNVYFSVRSIRSFIFVSRFYVFVFGVWWLRLICAFLLRLSPPTDLGCFLSCAQFSSSSSSNGLKPRSYIIRLLDFRV